MNDNFEEPAIFWVLLALAVAGMFALFAIMIGVVSAADLAPPRKHYIERCLTTGENPYPGQTLHVDKRCKSGLRWVYQR